MRRMITPITSADRYGPEEVFPWLGHVLEPQRKIFTTLEAHSLSRLTTLFQLNDVRNCSWTTLNTQNFIENHSLGWKSVVNRLKGWTSSGVKNFSMWFQYMTKSWKHFLRIIPIGRNNRYYHTTRGSSLIVRNICLKWFTMNFVVLKKWFRRGFVLPGAQKVYWVSEGVGFWVARKYFLDGSRT